jgi:glutaredoxin
VSHANLKSDTAPLQVHLYGHEKCCLCAEAEVMLRELSHEYSFELQKVDVRADEQWANLRCQIPVVTVDGGNRVALRITPQRLRRAFDRALSRRQTTEEI